MLSRLNANPFLVACRNGAVSLDQLRHFLIQHHYYSQYFTRYLCALMGSIADQGEFKSLSCNLTEELSGGDSVDISHAELYRRSMDLMSAPPRSRPCCPAPASSSTACSATAAAATRSTAWLPCASVPKP